MKRKADEKLERPNSKAPRQDRLEQQDRRDGDQEVAEGGGTAINKIQNIDSQSGQTTSKPVSSSERAGVKRKASDEIQKPSVKAPRLADELNDNDAQLLREENGLLASKQMQAGPEIAGVDSAPSHNDILPNKSTSAGNNNARVNHDPTRQDTTSEHIDVNQNVDAHDQENQGNERTDAETHDKESIEYDLEQRKKYKKEIDDAFELLTQSSMLLQGYRYNEATESNADLSQGQDAQLGKICELACQPGMATNHYLKELSINFFSETERLQIQRQRTKKLEQEYREYNDEYTLAAKAFDAAVSKRTAILLSDPAAQAWPEAANKQSQIAAKEREEMDKLTRICTRVQ